MEHRLIARSPALGFPPLRHTRTGILTLATVIGAGLSAGVAFRFLGSQTPRVGAGAIFLMLGALFLIDRLTVAEIATCGALLIAGLVDLPTGIALPGMTASGLITLAIVALAGIAVFLDPPISGTWPPLPFAVLTAWACWSFLWAGVSFVGTQTATVLAAFFGCMCMASVAVRSERGQQVLARALTTMTFIAVGLYGLAILSSGFGGAGLVSPRAFALMAVVGLAWILAQTRYSSRWMILCVLAVLGAVLLSLSRIGFVTALLLVPLAAMGSKGITTRLRSIAVVCIVGTAFLFVFNNVAAFRDRFTEGDVKPVGNVYVSVSGRFSVWPVIWSSFWESPWIGHGAGSAGELTDRAFQGSLGHPHNDYLRLLHDFGVVGLSVWIAGIAIAIRSSYRAWKRSDRARAPAARFHLAALLAGVGVSISMFTDNPISYVFVMVPLGVLIGASRGLAASQPSGEAL